MELFNEYALLFAVALPVVAIVGIQVFLFVAGERGTLLFPSLGGYPSIEIAKVDESMAGVMNVAPAVGAAPVVAESCNEALEREAA